jgi:predicted ATPase/DNA-binding SARP family transcriptional activator
MAHLSLALLGSLQIRLDGAPVTAFESDKVRALLAYLALEADRPHRRAALAGLLWPERPERAAHLSLNQALANLRQAIGDRTAPVLRITPETIQFNRAGDYDLDVAAFVDLLTVCDQHPHRHPETCTSCARRFQQAVDRYRGSLLDQFFLRDSAAFEEWALLKREQLHRRAITALAQLAAYHERRGEYAAAQQQAWRLLELDPWREASHRQLMRVLALSGQRNAALAQYATCRRVLADELGVAPEEETTALYARIQRGESLETQRTARRATNLPASLTSFIGRESELAQIVDRIDHRDCRLLTLVGPGGTGKTRLALQVAADLLDAFPAGVWFVNLAPISDPTLVIPTIAQTLDIREAVGRPLLDQLKDYLHDKHMLLLLDNFEQIVDAAPQIADLLTACSHLTVLTTSREVLHIYGEHMFPVAPLALPPRIQATAIGAIVETRMRKRASRVASKEELTQYDAVRLFIERAQAFKPDFSFTNANAAVVAEICQRLDGLPLAIELAAARVKLFAPEALLRHLSRRLPELIDGPHDLPARQQTMRRTIAWSYDLLNDTEQTLFRRLGVFVGGCTLEAVNGVCVTVDDSPLDLQEEVMALVNKSLVRPIDGPDGAVRVVMLETIREYALEQLEARGEVELLRQRHAEQYLTLAEQAETELAGPQQTAWLDRLESDHANLCAVLQWAVGRGEIETALRVSGSLWEFWAMRGHVSEGRGWFEAILTRVSLLNITLPGKVLYGAALMAWAQGDYPSAYEINSRYLALSRSLGDQQGIALALHGLGLAAGGARDYRRASEHFEAGLAFARQLGRRRRIAGFLFNLGCVVCEQGNYERAKVLLEESLMLGQATRDTWVIACALHFLALVAREQADFERAGTYYQQSLALFHELGVRQALARSLSGLAGVAGRQGFALRAARLFGAADAFFKASCETNHEQDRFERDLAYTRTQLDEATFATAWAAGAALTLEQAIAEALNR